MMQGLGHAEFANRKTTFYMQHVLVVGTEGGICHDQRHECSSHQNKARGCFLFYELLERRGDLVELLLPARLDSAFFIVVKLKVRIAHGYPVVIVIFRRSRL